MINKTSYKYQGLPQANLNYEDAIRKPATMKYLLRLRQVMRSQLNGKNKIPCWNSQVAKGGEATGIKTRRLLTIQGWFHPISNTLILYAKQKTGG